MADAADSKSASRDRVGVRLPPPALQKTLSLARVRVAAGLIVALLAMLPVVDSVDHDRDRRQRQDQEQRSERKEQGVGQHADLRSATLYRICGRVNTVSHPGIG